MSSSKLGLGPRKQRSMPFMFVALVKITSIVLFSGTFSNGLSMRSTNSVSPMIFFPTKWKRSS